MTFGRRGGEEFRKTSKLGGVSSFLMDQRSSAVVEKHGKLK
jgi:hypothetical protein